MIQPVDDGVQRVVPGLVQRGGERAPVGGAPQEGLGIELSVGLLPNRGRHFADFLLTFSQQRFSCFRWP